MASAPGPITFPRLSAGALLRDPDLSHQRRRGGVGMQNLADALRLHATGVIEHPTALVDHVARKNEHRPQ
jgi:hypothetical protein